MQKNILLFFQEVATPFWDAIAEAVTMLGEQYFFIAVISFVYWIVSRTEGFRLAVIFVYSSVFNSILKIAFRAPRPFERLPEISGKRIETATGYSFPSGHTQGAATFFTTAALILKRWWASLIAAFIIVAVAVTRVYLGVHWPLDVIGGTIFGVLIAIGLNRAINVRIDEPKKLRRYFFILQAAIIILTIALFIMNATGSLDVLKVRDFFKISGISLGLVGGYFLEEHLIRFNPSGGSVLRKLLRYGIGLACTIGLLVGLKPLFPELLIFDYLRYAILGFWVSFLWPWIGIRIGLFEASGH